MSNPSILGNFVDKLNVGIDDAEFVDRGGRSGNPVVDRRDSGEMQHRGNGLKLPPAYETGTILTIRMRGHSRSPVPGQDYFAPAVVLEQFQPDGEISCLVWDSSAGTHYNASYPVRDIGVRGEGREREMYEMQSNIGEVLFSPQRMRDLTEGHNKLTDFIIDKMRSIVNTINDNAARMDNRIDKMLPRIDALEAFRAELDTSSKITQQEPAPVAAAQPATGDGTKTTKLSK